MDYTRLSQEERYQIQCLRAGGWSLSGIGKLMRRNKSTISREVRRNLRPDGTYAYRQAQQHSVARRHAASARPRIPAQTWEAVEQRLCEDWSPEQIAGAGTLGVSRERIYQYVVGRPGTGRYVVATLASASAELPASLRATNVLADGASTNVRRASPSVGELATGKATRSLAKVRRAS